MATKTASSSKSTTNSAVRPSKTTGANTTRLIAVTATGPIYAGSLPGVRIPLSSFLALLQELAARAVDTDAAVVSSLAQRLHGTDAHETWNYLGAGFGIRLSEAPPTQRVRVLWEVLAYVRRNGQVDGVESPLTAAVNAAWPYLSRAQLHSVLKLAGDVTGRSTFTDRYGLIVVDPHARTFTDTKPGQLKSVDPGLWLGWAEASIPEWRTGIPKNDLGVEQFGSVDDALERLGGDFSGSRPGAGPTGQSFPGRRDGAGAGGGGRGSLPKLGGPNGGLGLGGGYGDGLGFGGDDLGSLFGGSGLDQFGDSLGDLGGGGLPEFNGWGLGIPGGANSSGHNGPYSGFDFGASGGPTGFGAQVGREGASDWFSTAERTVGAILVVGGAIGVVGGAATGNPVAGAVGGLDVAVGLYLLGDASRRDDKAEAEANAEEKEKQTDKDKKAADKKDADKKEEGAKVPTVTPGQLPDAPPPTVTPSQLPDAPKEGDQYPDPHKGGQLPSGDGTVDPVDPRTLPAEDGSVSPVDPRMLPAGDGTVGPLDPRMLPADENGHGGNPTTIWEENGGGVTPTTAGRGFYATRIGGRGLLAGIVQTSARSFRY